jgi:hypothetical protein
MLRTMSRCKKRPKDTVGVSDDVRPGVEQRSQIARVDVEIVTAGRTGGIPAPVREHERPSARKRRQRCPGRRRASPAMN